VSGPWTRTKYTYEPFGSTVPFGSATSNSYQYTGRENDGTGVYYYRARYYSPSFGRFISEDPLGLGSDSLNVYEYVLNNPLSSFDPFGLQGCNSSCESQLIQQLQNIFPGSTFNPETKSLVIPQDTQTVQQTLQAQGYQEPSLNPFLYWDPFLHYGGWEFRTGTEQFSFHYRERYPPCPLHARDVSSCFNGIRNGTFAGRKTVLDQFHVDAHNPQVDPWGHLLHDFLHLP